MCTVSCDEVCGGICTAPSASSFLLKELSKCPRLDLMKTIPVSGPKASAAQLCSTSRKTANHCPDGIKVKGMLEKGYTTHRDGGTWSAGREFHNTTAWPEVPTTNEVTSGRGMVSSTTPAATEGTSCTAAPEPQTADTPKRITRQNDKKPHKGLIGTLLPSQLPNDCSGMH